MPRSLFSILIGLFSAVADPADPLLEYVKAPDPSFAWEVVGVEELKGGRATYIKLTSQTWRGLKWVHSLNIYEPAEVKFPDSMLLMIAGGRNDDGPPGSGAANRGFAMAKACSSRVAMIQQVPNQPLLGGKGEDDLIAETLLLALTTGDPTWPLLFPMAKSAVRAMDATQAWAQKEGKPASKFVVAGSSKRGWTTFLTAAVDPRVAAIAPMVFPNLKMKAQNQHAIESWGKPSEMIAAYTSRGLVSKRTADDPMGAKVRTWIDPYTYRDRLTMPLLQINGTNDEYWTLDSLNLYWDDLRGPRSVVYLPNAGHNLEPHTDWATNAVGALYRHAILGKPMPEVPLKFVVDGSISASFSGAPGVKTLQVWNAESPTLDFRKAAWHVAVPAISDGPSNLYTIPRRENGFIAAFGDATFEVDGLEFHLSTPIQIAGPKGAK